MISGGLRLPRLIVLSLALAAMATGGPAAARDATAAPGSATEMVRGTPVTLSRVATTGAPLLVVRVGTPGHPSPALGLDEMAAALDRLIGRLDAAHALPPRFAIQFGGIGDRLMPLLQARLARTGANWDTRRGTVKSGSISRVLADEALAAIAATPVAAIFSRRGYRLEASGGTAHVEVGQVPGFGAAVLPTYIGDIGIVAVRAAGSR